MWQTDAPPSKCRGSVKGSPSGPAGSTHATVNSAADRNQSGMSADMKCKTFALSRSAASRDLTLWRTRLFKRPQASWTAVIRPSEEIIEKARAHTVTTK